MFFAVPSAPQTFALVVVSSTGLTATWQPPVPANGNITGYMVYCRSVGGEFTVQETPAGGATAASITGLEPFTSYECYVTANTSVGEGSESNMLTQETNEASEFYSMSLHTLMVSCIYFIHRLKI